MKRAARATSFSFLFFNSHGASISTKLIALQPELIAFRPRTNCQFVWGKVILLVCIREYKVVCTGIQTCVFPYTKLCLPVYTPTGCFTKTRKPLLVNATSRLVLLPLFCFHTERRYLRMRWQSGGDCSRPFHLKSG